MIEDNVTWRSTDYTRNVTAKDKLINDRQMVQQGWITQWFKRGTNEINNYQIKNGTVAWYDAMFIVIFRITEYGNYTNKAEVLASDNL